MSEFEQWWATWPYCFPERTHFEKLAAKAGWMARAKFDATVCRATDECLDASANPEHFARAIEGRE